MRKILLISIALLIIPIQTEAKKNNFRGVWIIRNNITSKEKIDEILNNAVKKRFNNLIIQIRGRGDAYYNSKFVTIAENVRYKIKEFDPLHYFIKEVCKKISKYYINMLSSISFYVLLDRK